MRPRRDLLLFGGLDLPLRSRVLLWSLAPLLAGTSAVVLARWAAAGSHGSGESGG